MKGLVESDSLIKQQDEPVRYFSAYYYAERVLEYFEIGDVQKAKQAGRKVVENVLRVDKKTKAFLWIEFSVLN